MTTDTKTVPRYIPTSSHGGMVRVEGSGDGTYVSCIDHERIIEEVGLLWARELVKRDDALAASRAEVEGLKSKAARYDWIHMNAVLDGANGDQFDAEIDAAMEKGNV